jgi:hypothetical protein
MAPVIAGWHRAGRSWSGIGLLAGGEGADHRVGRDTAVLPERHSAVEDQHLVQLGAVGPQDVGGVDGLTPGPRCLVPDRRLPELARRSDQNLELLAVLMCFLPSQDQSDGTASRIGARGPSHMNPLQLPGPDEVSDQRHDDPGPDLVQIPGSKRSSTPGPPSLGTRQGRQATGLPNECSQAGGGSLAFPGHERACAHPWLAGRGQDQISLSCRARRTASPRWPAASLR